MERSTVDIYASYSVKDRQAVEAILRALESEAFSVWWDQELSPGALFEDLIRDRLSEAKAVLSFVSLASVRSEWVRVETTTAIRAGKLLPILLDDVDLEEIETLVSDVQYFDFRDWTGDVSAPEFQGLRAALARQVGGRSRRASLRQRTVDDVSSWAVTQTKNTKAAYSNFAEKFPSSAFATEARKRAEEDSEVARSGKIFLSYRRGDSKATARLVYERLKQTMPAEQIFFDIDSIPLGVTYRDYIRARLIECSTMLVIVGTNWIGRERWSKPRIRHPDDFVRMEVEIAFETGLRVIPVLPDLDLMPNARHLPEKIRRITELQAAELDLGKAYERDISLIVSAVSPDRGGTTQRAPESGDRQ